ncbi:MAG: competence/damage-inducible protein A, partial [Bacteroidota bacterium]
MQAYILTIGDEILIGQVTDTNATFMASALNEEGHDVLEHLSVADTHSGIMQGLDRALATADAVLITGGLGPTKDDITKTVLADYFGTELTFHEPTWERLQAIVRGFGREPNEHHRAQCFLPEAATILTNERGTAPGMWL